MHQLRRISLGAVPESLQPTIRPCGAERRGEAMKRALKIAALFVSVFGAFGAGFVGLVKACCWLIGADIGTPGKSLTIVAGLALGLVAGVSMLGIEEEESRRAR
jgi:hypothetical protein